MDLDLKGLIRKLDRTCTRALEGAAGLCVSRTHYEVTVEHMLAVLVEDANADVGPILKHFEIESSQLLRALQRVLESQRSGNTGRPVFSPLLVNWLQDAWLYASVEFGEMSVRPALVLHTRVRRQERYTAEDLSPLLGKIRLDELKRDFSHIVHASGE